MKWKKVKDALPKKSGSYFCVLRLDSGIEGVEDEQIYDICTFYNQKENYFHHRMAFHEVTHWMNLPELPKLND